MKKVKSKPKLEVPKQTAEDRWRYKVMAYCHECWGRGGFEMLRDKVWTRFWESEVRPDLTEYEFACYVVLPYCAHYSNRHDRHDLLRKPTAFCTRKAVKEYRRQLAQIDANYKLIFGNAQTTAARVSVPAAAPPEPPPQEDAGRFEQPPRPCDRRLRRVAACSGDCPVRLHSLKYRDVLVWCEEVTDLMQDRGEFPTVGCLMRWVHCCPGPDDRDEAVLAARKIAAIYYEEYQRELEQDRRLFDRVERGEVEPPKPKKEEKPPKPPKAVEARNEIVTVVGDGAQTKYTVFGHPVTAVLRWMGKDAWTHADARLAMTRLGIPEVKDNTLKAQLMTGRKGDGYAGRKPAAVLTPGQQDTLYALLEQDHVGAGTEEEADREHEGRSRERKPAEGRDRAGKHHGKAQTPQHPLPGKAGKPPAPGVRPPDQPARRPGRSGRPNPGKADRKEGVGAAGAKRPADGGRPVVGMGGTKTPRGPGGSGATSPRGGVTTGKGKPGPAPHAPGKGSRKPEPAPGRVKPRRKGKRAGKGR